MLDAPDKVGMVESRLTGQLYGFYTGGQLLEKNRVFCPLPELKVNASLTSRSDTNRHVGH
jgi:hypothetical protein